MRHRDARTKTGRISDRERDELDDRPAPCDEWDEVDIEEEISRVLWQLAGCPADEEFDSYDRHIATERDCHLECRPFRLSA